MARPHLVFTRKSWSPTRQTTEVTRERRSKALVVARPKRFTGFVGITGGRARKRPPTVTTKRFSMTMLMPMEAIIMYSVRGVRSRMGLYPRRSVSTAAMPAPIRATPAATQMFPPWRRRMP